MLRVFCCSLSCIIETSSNLHLLKLFIFAWFKMHLVYKTCIRDDTRKAPPPKKNRTPDHVLSTKLDPHPNRPTYGSKEGGFGVGVFVRGLVSLRRQHVIN